MHGCQSRGRVCRRQRRRRRRHQQQHNRHAHDRELDDFRELHRRRGRRRSPVRPNQAAGNSGSGGNGGGISNSGTLTITNSTIAGNTTGAGPDGTPGANASAQRRRRQRLGRRRRWLGCRDREQRPTLHLRDHAGRQPDRHRRQRCNGRERQRAGHGGNGSPGGAGGSGGAIDSTARHDDLQLDDRRERSRWGRRGRRQRCSEWPRGTGTRAARHRRRARPARHGHDALARHDHRQLGFRGGAEASTVPEAPSPSRIRSSAATWRPLRI